MQHKGQAMPMVAAAAAAAGSQRHVNADSTRPHRQPPPTPTHPPASSSSSANCLFSLAISYSRCSCRPWARAQRLLLLHCLLRPLLMDSHDSNSCGAGRQWWHASRGLATAWGLLLGASLGHRGALGAVPCRGAPRPRRAVQCSAKQCSAVPSCAVQCQAVQFRTMPRSTSALPAALSCFLSKQS
jgi:hypothetical protein